MELVVTCGSGLEPLLAEELIELGFSHPKVGFRAVTLEGDLEAIYQINYNSRIATRVLLQLKRFRCFDAKSLYNAVREANWLPYIPSGKTFAIDANVNHPNLRNSLYAAQVAKDGICDQLLLYQLSKLKSSHLQHLDPLPQLRRKNHPLLQLGCKSH